MFPYEQEFKGMHKLLDVRVSQFAHCYKIQKRVLLSAYDIFNSQKVDEYLQREGGCKRLVPGEVDTKLLEKRFGIAYRVVSQDHLLQNEDPIFCHHAQTILNKAREILQNRAKDRAYTGWFEARLRAEDYSETERAEAAKARREAAEERQKRKELEERLAEAENSAEIWEQQERKTRQLEQELAEERSKAAAAESQRNLEELLARLEASRQVEVNGGWLSVDKLWYFHFFQQGNQVSVRIRHATGLELAGNGRIDGRHLMFLYKPIGFVPIIGSLLGVTTVGGEVHLEVLPNGRQMQGKYLNFSTQFTEEIFLNSAV